MAHRARIKDFCRNDDGAVAILWAMALAVSLGLIALSFDIGRLGATQSELQSFADNVALAAAGELDGKADAITRATAAANLIADTQTFGDGGAAVGAGDYVLTFYSAIPAMDSDPMDPSDITTDPAEAVFVEVVVAPRTVALAFASASRALNGSGPGGSSQIGATAVAGYTQSACDVTPLMFCLPPTPLEIGDMVKLRSGGNGAGWGPGDFGFLDPAQADLGATCAGLNGAQRMICLLGAEQNITQCYNQRGVDTEPGQMVGIEDAVFNIRFDIYKSTLNGKKNDPKYPPAPNVLKGIVPNGGGACIGQNEQVSSDTVPLPRDDCFDAGTCSRFGDGNWASRYGSYIDVNHGNRNGVFDPGEDSHLTGFAVDPALTGTRYALYLREILHGNAAANGHILSGRSETGRPQCSSNMSTNPERRVVIAAGVDCAANPINGKEIGVPVEKFYEVFLTEPVGDDGASPPTLDIWVEVIGVAGGDGYSAAGPGGIFRDVVQLYR